MKIWNLRGGKEKVIIDEARQLLFCWSESMVEITMNGQQRENIRVGQHVSVVLKHDQQTGTLTEGIVERILTKSAFHPHGIKVKLSSGQVGRVQEIHE